MAEIHLRARHTKCAQTQDQECQTKEEIASHSVALLIDEYHAHEEGRKDDNRQVDVVA